MSVIKANREQLLLISVLFLGYTMIVYVRESVTYAAPTIVASEQMDNNDLGFIVSSQKLGYALIKVFGGTLVDMVDPGLVFTFCLVMSGLVGASFAACSSVALYSVTWFLCGLIQGPSWPACGVLLKNSIQANQFATWWSILSTSCNVAGTIGPLASQHLNSTYSWRAAFSLAGVLAVVIGVLSGIYLLSFKRMKGQKKVDAKGLKKSTESKSTAADLLVNRELLMACLVYFLFSVVRGACNDWSQHYLIQEKKQSAIIGSRFLSSQELGGIVGSVMAGYLSDIGIPQLQLRVLPRIKVQSFFSSLLTVGFFCLIYLVDAQSSQIWMSFIGFLLGFALYGCISLIGVICMEMAPDNLSGTAHSMGTLAGNGLRLKWNIEASHQWYPLLPAAVI